MTRNNNNILIPDVLIHVNGTSPDAEREPAMQAILAKKPDHGQPRLRDSYT
jgi:hypothetical protein